MLLLESPSMPHSHPTCACIRFARSATSPLFAYVSIPAPDSSLCRAAAPRLCPLQLLLPDCVDPLQTAVPRFRPLQLLLPDCVRFNCCSPMLQLQLPDCVRFDCCSPIASACSLTCSGRFQPMTNVFFVELSYFPLFHLRE